MSDFASTINKICEPVREHGLKQTAQDFATAIENRINSSGQSGTKHIGEFLPKILGMVSRTIEIASQSDNETHHEIQAVRAQIDTLDEAARIDRAALQEKLRAAVAESATKDAELEQLRRLVAEHKPAE